MDGGGGGVEREGGSLPQTCRGGYSMNASYCDATVMKGDGSARKWYSQTNNNNLIRKIWGGG